MTLLHAALHFEFARNALLAGLLGSVLCGVLGVFVVTKRLAFISSGISHAAFGGLGLAYFLGRDPRLGAVAVALACALALGALGEDRVRSHDSLIGVLYSAGMAAGILFIHLTPGYAPDLISYLFGDILLASRGDLRLALALTGLVLLVLGVLLRGFVAVAFDEVFAAVQGVPVRLLSTVLLALVALSVVLLIQVVGAVLVIALLTIPPLLSLAFARDLWTALAGSVLAGVAVTLGGLALSFPFDLPSGPTIVALGAGLLALVYLLRACWKK